VAEDDPSLRKLIARTLENQGYLVLTAVNGEDAYCLVETSEAPVDLVITDVIMPQSGGLELLKRVQEERPGLPVLLMSGYTDRAAALSDVLSSGVSFIHKPFGPRELLVKVQEILSAKEIDKE
jgi:two-component system cell cycle sensor histidine kinase/response regulator CckA